MRLRPNEPAEWLIPAAREDLPKLIERLRTTLSPDDRRDLQNDIAECRRLLRQGVPSWEEIDSMNTSFQRRANELRRRSG